MTIMYLLLFLYLVWSVFIVYKTSLYLSYPSDLILSVCVGTDSVLIAHWLQCVSSENKISKAATLADQSHQQSKYMHSIIAECPVMLMAYVRTATETSVYEYFVFPSTSVFWLAIVSALMMRIRICDEHKLNLCRRNKHLHTHTHTQDA